jgi:O-antigen ligase
MLTHFPLLRIVRNGASLLSFAIFAAVVALGPLPFGLTAPMPIAVCCIALAFSLATAAFPRGAKQRLVLVPVIICGAAYVAIALGQLSAALTGLLRPSAIWSEAAQVGVAETPLISWTKAAPWFALGPPLLFIMALLRGALLSKPVEARSLLAIVAIAGSIYALYGILSFTIEPTMLLWRSKTAYLDAVTGTFVNRNTAATYWGCAAVIWLLLGLEQAGRRHRSGHRRRMLGCVLGGAICVVALGMTGSRAGALLTIAALLLAAGLWYTELGQWSRLAKSRHGWLILVMIAAALMLDTPLTERIRQHGLSDVRRTETYAATVRMIGDHPWLGIGLGNFEVVFPRYRPKAIGSAAIWDRAHSTPLEMAAEMGVPLTILVGASCVILGSVLFTGCLRRRRDRIVPIAGFSVGFLGITHSMIDFSLQIAGFGVVCAAIVGCGLAQSFTSRVPEEDVRAQEFSSTTVES